MTFLSCSSGERGREKKAENGAAGAAKKKGALLQSHRVDRKNCSRVGSFTERTAQTRTGELVRVNFKEVTFKGVTFEGLTFKEVNSFM